MTLSSNNNSLSEKIDLYRTVLSDEFMRKFSKFNNIDDFFNSLIVLLQQKKILII